MIVTHWWFIIAVPSKVIQFGHWSLRERWISDGRSPARMHVKCILNIITKARCRLLRADVKILLIYESMKGGATWFGKPCLTAGNEKEKEADIFQWDATVAECLSRTWTIWADERHVICFQVFVWLISISRRYGILEYLDDIWFFRICRLRHSTWWSGSKALKTV